MIQVSNLRVLVLSYQPRSLTRFTSSAVWCDVSCWGSSGCVCVCVCVVLWGFCFLVAWGCEAVLSTGLLLCLLIVRFTLPLCYLRRAFVPCSSGRSLSDITCKMKRKWHPWFSEDSRFPSEIQWYKNILILNRVVLMFIQPSQSLLENLFVVVSFDIVAGTTNKSMYGNHCTYAFW